MTLEDQVTSTLHDLAAEVPPRSGLADVVLRRAHRRRRTLRLVTAGGTVVAVAAGATFVVADPFAGDGAGPRGADPATTQTPPDVVPTPIGTVTVDVTTLPEGPEPDVAWYADGALRKGGTSVPYDGIPGGIYVVEEVASGGFAVLSADPANDGLQVLLLDESGERTVLSEGQIQRLAVSPDGTRVAWALPDVGGTTLYVADTATGEVLHELERTGPDDGFGIVRAFLGDDRVIVEALPATATTGAVWDPAAGTLEPWVAPAGLAAISPTGELAVVQSAEGGQVVDTSTGEQLWAVSGYAGSQAFSADGRLVAYRLNTAPLGLTVADASTGESLVTFEGIDVPHVAWEPDGNLILEVWTSTSEMAVLRCGLDGQCELAAPIAQLEAIDGSMPYVVGGVSPF